MAYNPPLTINADGQTPTAEQFNRLQDQLQAALDALGSAKVVPVRGIIHVDFTAAELTQFFDSSGRGIKSRAWEGWAICNGLNGTKDMDGRFPRFETSGAQGTGGTDSSAHTHDRGAHSHALSSGYAKIVYDAVAKLWIKAFAANWTPSDRASISAYDGAFTTGQTYGAELGGSTASDGTGNTGAASATDNRPAYYELVPVQRIL